jgi:hypothetical protein
LCVILRTRTWQMRQEAVQSSGGLFCRSSEKTWWNGQPRKAPLLVEEKVLGVKDGHGTWLSHLLVEWHRTSHLDCTDCNQSAHLGNGVGEILLHEVNIQANMTSCIMGSWQGLAATSSH